mgnify:CR=1 FL=1
MFDRVEVFSATKASDRERLGAEVTEFIRESQCEVVDKIVTQSSDNEFHCVTITLFCKGGKDVKRKGRRR